MNQIDVETMSDSKSKLTADSKASLSLTVPRPSAWSIPLLHSQAADSNEPPNIGYHGRVEKIGGRVEKIEKQPINCQVPIKRGLHIRQTTDILFANTTGGGFGAKFDAFIDEILPECSIADVANLVRIAGKRSRDNTVSHLIRRLPDIACQVELLSSSAWEYKEISFILYGTQSCKESNDGYLRIMMTMSKIATTTLLRSKTITSQNLTMLLYGLRSNKFEGKGSKEMLSCLPRIVEKCTEPFDAQVVGNALYGLQGMRSDNADVLSLVRALSGQVARCKESLDAQAVGNALYGLQGMYSCVDCQALGLSLLQRFIKLSEAVVADDYTPEYFSCGRSVVVTLPFLRDHVTEGEVKECERIIDDIENKTRVRAFNEHGDPSASMNFQSRSERRMHAAVMMALEKSNMRLSHNVHLFGLIECDLVVRIHCAVDACRVEEDRTRGVEGDDSLLLNIEVDGVHHRREKKKRFCRLRDEYLQSRGVIIARIEVSALDAMNEQDLENWIMDTAAKALLL